MRCKKSDFCVGLQYTKCDMLMVSFQGFKIVAHKGAECWPTIEKLQVLVVLPRTAFMYICGV